MSNLFGLSPDSIIQLLSIVVYLAAVLWSGFAFWDIRQSHHSLGVKYLAAGIVCLAVATSVMFIAAQVSWALTGQQEQLSFTETAAWLLYDWLNGFAHLAMILAVRTFMRWESETPCQHGGVCPSAALARRNRDNERRIESVAGELLAMQRRLEFIDREEYDGR
jgi:hypothetical protein